MSKGNNGQGYDENFKKMIVELVKSNQKTLSEVDSEYGVTQVTIYKQQKACSAKIKI